MRTSPFAAARANFFCGGRPAAPAIRPAKSGILEDAGFSRLPRAAEPPLESPDRRVPS
ncbi:hypothetical protein B8V81_0431 [Paenibacillus pasadenensis]|uniref:Uncharacterized protein n=1 Tax=Paenibacillus pasadenensis TaxID=217090 RepID=A0A2N5ND84_9BACL|nr:hypothetical protein B8V81_0431 [Paenibacillus pasadenensis]